MLHTSDAHLDTDQQKIGWGEVERQRMASALAAGSRFVKASDARASG